MPNEVKLLPCEDKCAICGKLKMQHSTSSGYGVCQIYPIFVSEREMLERLSRPTTVVTDEVVERVARAIDEALPESDRLSLAPSQIRRAAKAAIASMPTVVTGEQPLQSVGAIPGSHPADQAPSGLGASRFDPEREKAAFTAGWLTRQCRSDVPPEEAWLTYLNCLE